MSQADVWMPLYIGDYLADTGHLTAQQHGCYLLMLMHQWRTGPLPDDDRQLAAIAKVTPKVWSESIRKVVLNLFSRDDHGWSQKRLAREREMADGKSEKRRKAGKIGADKKWQSHNSAKQVASELDAESHRQTDRPSPSPSQSEKKEGSLRSPSQKKPRSAKPSRACRLPEDWTPGEEGFEFARQCGLDPQKLFVEFRDYWAGVPGVRGTKLDWPATWRNRCRDVAERGGNSGPISRSNGQKSGGPRLTVSQAIQAARDNREASLPGHLFDAPTVDQQGNIL